MSVYKALNTWLLLKLVSRRSYSKMWKDRGESREHEVTEAGRDVCIDDVFRAAAALREERRREKATGRMKERCVRNWTRTRVDHRELIPTSVCVTLLAHGSYLTALCLRPRDHDSCIIYLKAWWKIVLTSRARPGKAFVRHALGCCYCRCRLHRKWLPSPRYVRGCVGLVRVAVRLRPLLGPYPVLMALPVRSLGTYQRRRLAWYERATYKRMIQSQSALYSVRWRSRYINQKLNDYKRKKFS